MNRLLKNQYCSSIGVIIGYCVEMLPKYCFLNNSYSLSTERCQGNLHTIFYSKQESWKIENGTVICR